MVVPIFKKEDEYPFSVRIDKNSRGDKARVVLPRLVIVEDGFEVYYFPWTMFKNPKYTIPKRWLDLFILYIFGGSRAYSSDGSIPVLHAAVEARKIIQRVREIAMDPSDPRHFLARRAVFKQNRQIEDWEVVRGAVGLVLGNWMAEDWQKKRFTDDIDFYWEEMDSSLWNEVLQELGWFHDSCTGGNWTIWKKKVPGVDGALLECCNDTLIGRDLDGLSGAAVAGTGLKNIVRKKIDRCHEVDVSDILNIAIKGWLNVDEEDEEHPWRAIVEVLNRASKDDVAHLIVICQHAYPIAKHLRNVGNALLGNVEKFLDPDAFHDDVIKKIYNMHTPILPGYYLEPFHVGKATTVDEMRHELYKFFLEEGRNRKQYGSALATFARAINAKLNDKFSSKGVKFKIVEDVHPSK